jgi:class 3 adenylate cyclase/tetratricopeptide (TPR) repeat protein/ribosomal protein L40E
MRCTKCGTNNPSTNNFCAKCGNALAKHCVKCKAENPPTSDFCGKCGAPLGNGAGAAAATSSASGLASGVHVAPESTSPEALEGERKTVTALFGDIKGSMELIEDLDPEEARAIVDPALKLMMEAVHRYGGYVAQSTGDGIFALFGAPIAYEDHPQRALYAALRMQEELKRYSDRIRAEGRLPIQVRVGVNSGEVVMRSVSTGEHAEYVPVGHATSLAARMQLLAPIGSIAATEPVRRLCEGYFIFKSLGPTKVKGVSEPVEVYEVTGLGPLRTRLERAAGRGLSKFVGREREMEAMKNAAEQAEAGHGQIVAAMAEAGVGKSRLLFEFKAVSQTGWMVLEALSVSHGKASAYLPVIDLLQSYFKIVGADDQRARRAKVTGNVLTLDRSFEDTLPYLFALLGIIEGEDPLAQMDAQIKKRRTLEAIKRILLRESLNQPVMVIFEDLHWIDEETQALLNVLADSIGTAKILLLVNYRPEYTHSWGNKTYYTQLRLDPLGREGAEELLTALVGDAVEVRPLKRLIIERTQGNPFFMEETVLVLFDEGAIVRNGAVKIARSLNLLKIPPTVQAILAARIDRLPTDEKDLLQTLAVMGKEFQLGSIRAVTAKSDDELNRMLGNLQLGEFIYEQPAFPEIEYTFKHALTQEVAYNSVLTDRRRTIHERIGQAIEELVTHNLDDHLTDLAYHYGHSGNRIKAVDYLTRAGTQTLRRAAAYSEAMQQLRRALEILKEMPPGRSRESCELELQTAIATAAYVSQGEGSVDAGKATARAVELAVALDDIPREAQALAALGYHHIRRGELRRASEISRDLHILGQEKRNLVVEAEANQLMGDVAMRMGEFRKSEQHFSAAAAEDSTDRFTSDIGAQTPAGIRSYRLVSKGVALWYLGFPDQALALAREAVMIVEDAGDPYPYTTVNSWAGITHLYRGELALAEDLLRKSLNLCAERGFSVSGALNTVLLGLLSALQGKAEAGLEQVCQGLEISAAGSGTIREQDQLLLAWGYALAGKPDEGSAALDKALEYAERSGDEFQLAEMHLLKGLLFQGRSNSKGAEKSLRTSVEIASRQSAKSWELRATTSLARLLAAQGERDEARTMLSDIYGWFTEGFDTADLKDAKALLDELSN